MGGGLALDTETRPRRRPARHGGRVDLVRGRLEHGPTPDGDLQLRAWLEWPP